MMSFNTLKLIEMSLELFINNKKKEDLNPLSEDQIKQGTILPLLEKLGWNIHDVTGEVVPEFSTDKLKVDYALKNNGKLLVLIEAKKGSENLENHQEQLLNYSFKKGVKLAILTNGLEWWFYLPLNEGNWTNRRFYTIVLNNQETQNIILNFKKFLGKEKIISGKSIEDANEIYKSKKIKETLEKVWTQMINEEDNGLFALIAKKVEDILDYKLDNTIIKKFLKSQYDTILKESNENLGTKDIISNNLDKTNNNQNLNWGNEKKSSKDEQIYSFKFKEKKVSVKYSRDILLELLHILSKTEHDFNNKIFSLYGRKRPYFSKDKTKLRDGKLIEGTDIYVETNRSKNDIISFCYKILKLFGYSKIDLKFYDSNGNVM